MPVRWEVRPTGRERGATGVEYAALLLVSGVVIAVLLSLTTPIGGEVERAACRLMQGGCAASDPTASDPTASDPIASDPSASSPTQGSTWQGKGLRAWQSSRPRDGGVPSRTRSTLGGFRGVMSWFLPNRPGGSGRDDGDEAKDDLREVDDLGDWADRVNEMIDGKLDDSGYAGDFFDAFGSDTLLDMFRVAYNEYAGEDGILDAGELARLRADLGPLAQMFTEALKGDTLPDGYREALLNGDPMALAMLISAAPESLPPEFLVKAVENILDGPVSPGYTPRDTIYPALAALARNPEATQDFLQSRDNLRLLAHGSLTSDVDGTGRGPALVLKLFEVGLDKQVGSREHQVAFANIIQHVIDNDDVFDVHRDDGQHHAAAMRRLLADRLTDTYLPWMSRVGQRDNPAVLDPPGNSDPPGPPLPIDGDRMIEFLGIMMTDDEIRADLTGAVQRYADQIDPVGTITPTTGGAEWLPFIERVDVVTGLYTLLTEGQNEAQLSATERRDAALRSHDQFTALVSEGIGQVPGAGKVNEAFKLLSAWAREATKRELDALIKGEAPSPYVKGLYAGLQEEVEAQLRREHPGARDEDIEGTAAMVTSRYTGQMFPIILRMLSDAGK